MVTQDQGREDLWKQYQLDVELYKHYFDLTLKINAFYYVLTGAIVSFYLSRADDAGLLKYSLLLPVALGVALSGLSIYGGILNLTTRRGIRSVAAKLGLDVYPEFFVLSAMLWLSASLFFLTACSLGVLLYWADAMVKRIYL